MFSDELWDIVFAEVGIDFIPPEKLSFESELFIS